jgi:hypothetical protein
MGWQVMVAIRLDNRDISRLVTMITSVLSGNVAAEHVKSGGLSQNVRFHLVPSTRADDASRLSALT